MDPLINALNRHIENHEGSKQFRISETPYGGRGCIAVTRISSGEVVHSCMPFSSSIARPYRKEVCLWCFQFQGGKTLPCRLGQKAQLYFCSEVCRSKFIDQDIDDILADSLVQLELNYLHIQKYQEDVDIRSSVSLEEIENAWNEVERWDQKISTLKPSKRVSYIPHIDEAEYNEIKYIIGVLFQYYRNDSDELVYFNSLQSSETEKIIRYPLLLDSYIKVFKYLRLTCKSHLQKFISVALVRAVIGKNLTNAFGIWSKPESITGEKDYFGFSVYPSASYFNHSCLPNLNKIFEGRRVIFKAFSDINPGDELCISYIGKPHEDESVRQKYLDEWFFNCLCIKCTDQQRKIQ